MSRRGSGGLGGPETRRLGGSAVLGGSAIRQPGVSATRALKIVGLAGLLVVSSRAPLGAQQHRHEHADVPAEALRQIREVAKALEGLSTPEAAGAAGFHPVLGWIPTMGTHWVSGVRMLSGERFTAAAPSQLMFSPIGGKETLVGAAYAYLAAEQDSTRPASFAGNPPWHEHPDLAPPGMTLVMLHVWFVDSPDGPFAGHNPWLPFWALGLEPPGADRLHSPEAGRSIRMAALALGEIVDSAGAFPRLARRPGVAEALAPHRQAIRSAVSELDRAGTAKDWARWSRLADRLGTHWSAIRKIYLDAVPRPDFRTRMEKFLDEMERGGHE